MFATSGSRVVSLGQGWLARSELNFIMVEVIFKLPDSLAHAFGETAEIRGRRLMEDAAVEEYRIGQLSQRQVGEMLGLDYWQTEEFLAGRNIPVNYSLGDLQTDRETLAEVLRGK